MNVCAYIIVYLCVCNVQQNRGDVALSLEEEACSARAGTGNTNRRWKSSGILFLIEACDASLVQPAEVTSQISHLATGFTVKPGCITASLSLGFAKGSVAEKVVRSNTTLIGAWLV